MSVQDPPAEPQAVLAPSALGAITAPALGGAVAAPGARGGGRAAPHAVPGLAGLDRRWERVRTWILAHPMAVRLALATIVIGSLAVAVVASSGPSTLVPQSKLSFPGWESGPLGAVLGHLDLTHATAPLNIGFTAVVVAMLLAYLVLLAAVRTVAMRTIVALVLAAHVILLLSPPLQLTDLFNYLGYARLGGLHALNPYTHGIAAELHDPIYRFATWYHLRSPYGPLFTVLTYPVSFLSLAGGYWALKAITVMLSLGFIALVSRCARLLGRDPRFAIVFVAANPIYLLYEVAGFHNDFFMLVPSTAAIALLLARRDRSAGALLMVAVAVKFTAVLLLPFLLLAARPPKRRLAVLTGAALAAVPLLALQLAAFGLTLPNLTDQTTLLTPFSIPNVVGLLLGLGGGSPALLRVITVLLVVTVALLLRRRGDWLADAGWSTMALIASLAWLVPWYVVWLLPLAALARNRRLRQVALVLTAYLVFAFTPATGMVMSKLGLDLMGGSAGQASRVLQVKLEH